MKMVDLPKYIKISHHRIKVVCPYNFRERTDLCGQYDDNAKEIRLTRTDAGGSPHREDTVAVTLLHEIIHALDILYGHRALKGNEGAVDALAEGLYGLIVKNPELIVYFMRAKAIGEKP
jgi:hypothetical protein